MLDIDTLFARLQENELIARKFFEIQTEVLATLNLEDFFDKLLCSIKRTFDVPHVWLSVINPSKTASLIHRFAPTEPVNNVSREDFMRILEGTPHPRLLNRDLERVRCLHPDGRRYDFGSVAITPISLDGEIIGSFNQADPSPRRFQPGIDTGLLEQLAVVVSICLSNVLAHEELRVLAFRDPLTGLLNRRAMERVLERELARARRYGTPLCAVFVDLDDFKQVNDRYGHDCGDELLVHTARTLRKHSRTSDIVARFAGDEFVLILPGIAIAESRAFMERIQAFLASHPLVCGENTVPVRFSYGVAAAEGGMDAAGLLKQADEQLYAAKKDKHR